jgi:hypothetical protein
MALLCLLIDTGSSFGRMILGVSLIRRLLCRSVAFLRIVTIASLRYCCLAMDRSPCYVCRSGLVISQFDDFLAMLCLRDERRSLATCLSMVPGDVSGAFLAPLVALVLSDCLGNCDGGCDGDGVNRDSFVLCQFAWQRCDSSMVIIMAS